ncbi:sensor histidine kinase [Subtercola sp. YIM 133946]|uniref:sensor histidine kinase n=1 Tax=Subtercola sp. YIM 133946 TaxID=3118909 RepID=UPI002F92ACC2
MSLVLPTDVEGVVTSRALGKAAVWVSSVFLAVTFVLVVAFKIVIPQAEIAIALAGLAITGVSVAGTLLLTNRLAVATLMIVAAAGLFVFTYEIGGDVTLNWTSDALIFSLPKIALTVIGVAGRTLRSAIARCLGGFVLASLAVQVAARMVGIPFALDFPAIATCLGLILLLAALWFGRRQSTRGAATMQAAAEAEERMIERSRIASRASAALHDTVLNDLHALTLTAPGSLTEAHRAFLVRDIAALAHPGLLVDEAMLKVRASGRAIVTSGLAPVVQSARARGLRVTISGDPGILAELEPGSIAEVVKAIDQALVNVSKHAEIDVAELAVVAGVDSINVVVSDAGCGFDPKLVDEQRMGLRVSVHQRIESLGGTVKVWSTPGAGTAVLMSIPRAEYGLTA